MFVLKKRADDLTDALDEARRDGEKYRMEIAELKVNDSELRRTVEKRAISERMAYNSNEQTRRDIIALQSKCRTLEEENERLSERLTQSEENCFESSKSAQRFHQLAEASARETEILQRANDVAANENKELRRELNELHKEVREIRAQTNETRTTVEPVTTTAPPVAPVASDAPRSVLTPLNVEPGRARRASDVQGTIDFARERTRNCRRRSIETDATLRRFRVQTTHARRKRILLRHVRRGSSETEIQAETRACRASTSRRPIRPSGRTRASDRELRRMDRLHRRLGEGAHATRPRERRARGATCALPTGAGRTMLERERKTSALERLDSVHEALRKNRIALSAVKESR